MADDDFDWRDAFDPVFPIALGGMLPGGSPTGAISPIAGDLGGGVRVIVGGVLVIVGGYGECWSASAAVFDRWPRASGGLLLVSSRPWVGQARRLYWVMRQATATPASPSVARAV